MAEPTAVTEVEPTLDHLVYAAPDLPALVRRVQRLTGRQPVEGGRHVGRGTRNLLLGLGGSRYLELIGPDADQAAPERPRPFGIDRLTGPSLVTWAVRPADLDAVLARARRLGHDPGPVQPMSRRTPTGQLLSWRLSPPYPNDPERPEPAGGLVPFLIDWGDTVHPTANGLPQATLVRLRGTHPEPESVLPQLSALGVRLDVVPGPRPALSAVLVGEYGEVVLE